MRKWVVAGLVVASLLAVPLGAYASNATSASSAKNPFAPRAVPSVAFPTHVTVHGSYVPIVGDFDCNGRADIFWYAPGRAQDFVWYSTPSGFVSHEYTVNGAYRTATADLDGDGCSDIVWHAPGAAADYLWFGRSTRRFAVQRVNVWGSYTPIAMHGKLWWFDPAQRTNPMWSWAGGHFAVLAVDMHALLPFVGTGAVRPIVVDVDENLVPDVVMYRPGVFRAAYLYGTGRPNVFSPHFGATPGDDLVPVVGNFDGNIFGRTADEIVWYGPGAEPDYTWMSGWPYERWFLRRRTNVTGARYEPVAGDFDGDGKDDLFWYVPGVGGEIWTNVPHQAPLGPPPYASDITAGGEHGCAIVNGVVKCWGDNRFGELGDGTHVSRALPAPVVGLPPGATKVVAGFGDTCAIVAGGAWCWGLNNYGELGDETTKSRAVPVQVAVLSSGVTSIALSDNYTGREHTCAVANGAAWCWGYNGDGELGTGTTTPTSAVPAPVHGLSSGVISITTGDRSSCASANGTPECWGANDHGQLGTGNTTPSRTPVPVSGVSNADEIAAGSTFACALAVNTAVRCWGDNREGQLGTGDTTSHLAATPAVGLGNLNGSLTAGFDAACVSHADSVYCWGLTFGSTPAHVLGLINGAVALSAGVAKCAITGRGDPVCWGPNEKGELGNGTIVSGSTFDTTDNAPSIVLHLS